MFPLAFVAGWLQGHWWGFVSRNYVVWPTFFLMNVFIALKGSHFWIFIYESLHCHYQQSDQGLNCLPFSAVWSECPLFAILKSDICLHYLPLFSFLADWSRSILFAILSILIRVSTTWHSQQSDQGLHCLPLSAVWSGSTQSAILSLIRGTQFAILTSLSSVYTTCDSFLAVLWRSTVLVILSSLIRVYTFYHSQQSDQGLHCLPFSAVWSGSTLFAIFSSLISVYTIYFSQQSDQGLHYLS